MRGALCQDEAAAYLGVCVDTFRERVRPFVPRVELGRKLLFAPKDLDAWFDRQKRSP